MGNTKAAFLHNIVILKAEASLQAREELTSAAAGWVWVLTDPVLVEPSLNELAGQTGLCSCVGVLGLQGFTG